MKGRMLVIDDEKAFCSFLRCLFNQDGFAVETARNGKDGLAIARAQRFDVIITDLMMPDLNGIEIIARLRADGNDVPIIAMTGYSPFELNLNVIGNHPLDIVLYKPFSSQEIRDVVAAALVNKGRDEIIHDTSGDRFFPFNNRGL
jgi:DNA-binding response OmpR family regulator